MCSRLSPAAELSNAVAGRSGQPYSDGIPGSRDVGAGHPLLQTAGAIVQIENSFMVPADIETAWQTLLDIEAIVPCMPGATLISLDGDSFVGSVKVKLGPVAMTYEGTANFEERNATSHTARIRGTGKETRGTGTAQALITTVMVAQAPDRTRVDVTTELTITGKAAQFGRGVMQDVASRLVDQFAGNLEQLIASRSTSAEPGQDGAGVAAPPPIKAADSIDLMATAGAPILKRVIPVIAVVIVAAGLLWWLIAR